MHKQLAKIVFLPYKDPEKYDACIIQEMDARVHIDIPPKLTAIFLRQNIRIMANTKRRLRSATTTMGRHMAGARSLWRANGMEEKHFGRPVIAIANSFTQFVPGHGHLKNIGKIIKDKIEAQGYFAAEFNTMGLDDGIAMGHDGMLYSLPSREIIADSVEYTVNGHKADALIAIGNCDKIAPGMLLAGMRLNIPFVYFSGGPMEAGKIDGESYDLVDAIVMGANDKVSDKKLSDVEKMACPTCGSCSGMFTANSMNCLAEAIGLAVPGNGSVLATHKQREQVLDHAVNTLVENTRKYYFEEDDSVLPRNIANREAFLNAMRMDIAMGGSTNTVLHLLAMAQEGEVDFTMEDINALSRKTPVLSKVAPSSQYHMEDVNRAGGVLGIMHELHKAGLVDGSLKRIEGSTLAETLQRYNITSPNPSQEALDIYSSAPGNYRNPEFASQNARFKSLDNDRTNGCIRSVEHAYSQDGGLAILYGNIAQNGCIVKTAGVDESVLTFSGKARVLESQDEAITAILRGKISKGDVVVIRYEGPSGGPGMQEMLYPTSYIKTRNMDKDVALITDGRFSGGTSGLSIGHISPEASAGGEIALVQDGDVIDIDIPNRKIDVRLTDEELQQRKQQEESHGKEAYAARSRTREVSKSLKMYAKMVNSADKGAVRTIE